MDAFLHEPFSLETTGLHGESRSFGLRLTDAAGNQATVRLPHVTFDDTPPVFVDPQVTNHHHDITVFKY